MLVSILITLWLEKSAIIDIGDIGDRSLSYIYIVEDPNVNDP